MTGLMNPLPKPITLTDESECAMIDGVREVPLRSLAPGRRFELVLQATTPYPHKRYSGTVIRHGPGTSAVVLDHAERERTFGTQEGQVVTLQVSGGVVYWSPGTAVLPLGKDTRDISRWTTKGGTGVGLTPEAASQDEVQERGKAMAKTATATVAKEKYAALPGVPSGHARPAKTRNGKGLKVVRAAKTPKELNACRCGCGERVTGQFRQGHDSKYYSLLRQVKAGTLAFNQLPKAVQSECKDRAGAMRILASSKH